MIHTRWAITLPDLTAKEAAALHTIIDALREGDGSEDEDNVNFDRWVKVFGLATYPEDFRGIQFVFTALPVKIVTDPPLPPDSSGLSATVFSDGDGDPQSAGTLIQRWLEMAESNRVVAIVWAEYSDENVPGSNGGGYGVVSRRPDASVWLFLNEAVEDARSLVLGRLERRTVR